MDMAAVTGVAGALKAAFDVSKSALDLHDAAAIRAKVVDMQREISSAMASAITAQKDQMAMLENIRKLEKDVADLKTWEAEKQRYELVPLALNVVAYAQKKSMQGAEPPHYLCANCFSSEKKSFLQQTAHGSHYEAFRCNGCKEELQISKDVGEAVQFRPAEYF